MLIRVLIAVLVAGMVVLAASLHPFAAGATAALSAGAVGIGREVWKRRQKAIVEQVDRRLGQLASRFAARYREYVLGQVRYIEVKGLATVGFASPELDEVYVDVSLARTAPHAVGSGLLSATPTTERRSIGEFLDQKEPRIVAVLGAPGGGKTTLLRHTARELCRTPRGRRRTIPILLYLRDHVRAIVDSDMSLPALVRTTIDCLMEPAGWFDQRLRDGDCLVMLDGLDEVARAEDRMKISAWVERQAVRYSRNDFVITSRPQGYVDAPITGATVVQVRPFTEGQVEQFVKAWYLAVERHSTGHSGEIGRAHV